MRRFPARNSFSGCDGIQRRASEALYFTQRVRFLARDTGGDNTPFGGFRWSCLCDFRALVFCRRLFPLCRFRFPPTRRQIHTVDILAQFFA